MFTEFIHSSIGWLLSTVTQVLSTAQPSKIPVLGLSNCRVPCFESPKLASAMARETMAFIAMVTQTPQGA